MTVYRVEIDQYGVEVASGLVSGDTTDYWISRGVESLKSHAAQDDIKHVLPEHNLYPWYEQDNFLHINGVEFSGINTLRVVDQSTETTVLESRLDAEWVQDNAWVLDDPHSDNQNEMQVITFASLEKGVWEYDLIETSGPIDYRMLQFFLYCIDSKFVLDHLQYGDEKLMLESSDTRGQGFEVTL
jgi:hypothetical protein